MELVARLGLLLGLLVLLQSSFLVSALEIAYCSSMNTGSGFKAVIDTFQSHGFCHDACIAKYAFAVIQDKSCWCSNVAPGENPSTDDCGSKCPGYPSETCGSKKKGLYVYIALNSVPSSTAAGSTKTTSSVSLTTFLGFHPSAPILTSDSTQQQSFSSTISSTFQLVESKSGVISNLSHRSILTTVQVKTSSPASSVTVTVTNVPIESSTSSSTPSSDTKTTTPPTTAGKPTLSVQTVSGQPVTVTVSGGATQGASTEAASGGKSLSGGAIAGVVIGVLLALAIIIALFFWLYWRKKRSSPKDVPEIHHSPYEPTIPSPTFEATVPQMTFNKSRPANPQNPNRLSVPAFTDHRMKKDAVLYPNGSRQSNISLQDHQDYSRPVLRVSLAVL
ncbi:hypothetical protein AJ80_05091 [Polytolypa hystricis UAMH7299]|uniref:WSC domain-containing protein n=1 Tax=Polytolypa hystricis (strain UAMH7299) TaxID=1447883 RepID=A0A2B7Y5L7_POLH7|nr:hypothetical protein AJ80_05091 [Polytolypa hystricis UAMH7299]